MPKLRVVVVDATRSTDLPVALRDTLRDAPTCAASESVFDVVEAARLPKPTARLAQVLDSERRGPGSEPAFDVVALGPMDPASLASRSTPGAAPGAAEHPLLGVTVVVTRPAHQVPPLAYMLERLGARVVALPAIAITPPADLFYLRAALSRLAEYACIVFTSDNGVEASFAELRAMGRDARALAGRLVAAIGPGTARALERHGVVADLIPEAFVGESLADAVAAALPHPARIALFRATEAREALPGRLEARGHAVDIVPAYTTVRSFDAARFRNVAAEARAVAVTFTSASTVKSVVEAVGREGASDVLERCALLSIGPVTTAALEAGGLRVAGQANPYTVDGLVEATVRWAAGPSRSNDVP